MKTTPFNDGHVWFTQDDGRLYIDALVGGRQRRVCVSRVETVATQKPNDMVEGDTWLREVE